MFVIADLYFQNLAVYKRGGARAEKGRKSKSRSLDGGREIMRWNFYFLIFTIIAHAKMASGGTKKWNRVEKPTFDLQVRFNSTEEIEAFMKRLDNIRSILTPGNSSSIDNCGLMVAMFDAVEKNVEEPSTLDLKQSFMRNSGKSND